jgi:hypothetical protein
LNWKRWCNKHFSIWPENYRKIRKFSARRLTSIGLANGAKLDLLNRPVLDCEFAAVFTEFVRELMAPLRVPSSTRGYERTPYA